VGSPVTLAAEGDFEAFKANKNANFYGEIFYGPGGWLNEIIKCLESNFKDSMIKEGFLEAFGKKKIIFDFDSSLKESKNSPKLSMKDGCFKIHILPTEIKTNTMVVGHFSLEKIL